ncbi:peptidoglycan/xylan/chitin deacetylase (PgdA/CDA1 family) [Nitrobacteraceae bacterium AZCC 1564]
MSSKFVISLDFELMWGVRDHLTPSEYGKNVLGVRDALPRVLDLFQINGIRATWATVGMVFCESKDELIANLPSLRPSYKNHRLSNYEYLDELGTNESSDKFYFGGSLVKLINSCPGQEIGSHSFSHYYCLEEGQTPQQFEADISAAVQIARSKNIQLKSFVFPRNQYSESHLTALKHAGFKTYRGNEQSWLYTATPSKEQGYVRRLARLADHYVNLSGQHVPKPIRDGHLINVQSSRFLRPFSHLLERFDNRRLQRIFGAIDAAANTGGTFHLWWHPHNFGLNVLENMSLLSKIIGRYHLARERHGMVSVNMGDFA